MRKRHQWKLVPLNLWVEKLRKYAIISKKVVIAVRLRKLIPVLVSVLLLLGWYLMFGRIPETMTVEAGNKLSISDFGGMLLQSETNLEALPLTIPGEYPVTIRCLWRRLDCCVVVVDTVAPKGQVNDLTAFCTQIPEPEDFLISADDATALTVSYGTSPDTAIEGTQTITICLTDLGGNVTELEADLTLIFDDTPPQINGASDHRVYLGTVLDLAEGVSISDDLDENAALTIDDTAVNWESAGEYPVTYRAVDVCGNETMVTITVTVIHDTTPPQLMGVTELSIYLGSTVAYRKGIIVTDDTDPSPMLTVDSSQVDLSSAGTYPITYTATDCVGNTAVRETTITVTEAPQSYVEEAVILEAADAFLAKIITGDMSVREQVQVIYDYLDRGFYYVNTSDKADWMQAAYKLLQTQRGDCFNFYALSRLLFEKLNIPNLTVQRLDNPWRSGSHWWSMVSVDGGKTWYHYDSTPHMESLMETCLVTDADLEQFNQTARGYYEWDRSAYPAAS